MVTVLLQRGFRVMIYTRDHEPMHVHVWYQDGEVIIRFDSEVEIVEVNRMTRNDVRRAKSIVVENREVLIEEWREIHG